MATLKEQLKCECNSEGWSDTWIYYIKISDGETPTQAHYEGIKGDNTIHCDCCGMIMWVNPSELNEWFDLRSMNTIW